VVYTTRISVVQPGTKLESRFGLRLGVACFDHPVGAAHYEGVQSTVRGYRPVRADRFLSVLTIGFVVVFFAYLFGPLIVMSITAFNSSQFPRVSPFECFSVEWFEVLVADKELMIGLRNSILIGGGVVVLSLPIGLAGALMLTQVTPRLRAWYYTVIISPILIPGVVLGISTLVFWRMISRAFHVDWLYDGIVLTILGQATFISAYSMLVFLSRLQRFDTAQEEAALDLGATHVQTFRKVLLPFLKPAIGSAAVLAFLASFENYNTTVFTILSDKTLTTVLASKVRYGINPSISALAVIIVMLTLIGAVIFEIIKRREAAQDAESMRLARGELERKTIQRNLLAEPTMVSLILFCAVCFSSVYLIGSSGVEECKVQVKLEKRRLAEQRIREREQREMSKQVTPVEDTDRAVEQPKVQAQGTQGYTNIFAPSNLEGQVDSGSSQEEEPAKGTEGYLNIFAPSNLEGQVESGDSPD